MLLEIDVTTFKLFHFEHFETPMSDYSHQGNTDRFLTLQDLKLKLRIFLFIFFCKECERDRERWHMREKIRTKKKERKMDRLRDWGLGNNKVLRIKLNRVVKCCREAQRHETAAATTAAAIEVLSVDTQVCAHLTSQKLQRCIVSAFSSCPIVCPNTMKYSSSTGPSFLRLIIFSISLSVFLYRTCTPILLIQFYYIYIYIISFFYLHIFLSVFTTIKRCQPRVRRLGEHQMFLVSKGSFSNLVEILVILSDILTPCEVNLTH